MVDLVEEVDDRGAKARGVEGGFFESDGTGDPLSAQSVALAFIDGLT